jgi:predicted Holliday junction resolvase-like endonuclease
MNNSAILVILLLSALLIVVILAAIVGYFWISSKTKSTLLAQAKEQGDAIRKEAQEQLQRWKDQELSVVRQQTYDAAKGQAIQELQEQMRNWQEKELQQVKQQIYDAAKGQSTQEAAESIQRWQQTELQVVKKQLSEALRGEAIREAQEQLVRWRTDELENAKQQIREVLSKEAAVTFEQWKAEAEKEIRQDAISKSQSVTMGKMTEHIVPYLPGFGFNPSDARFIGSPIDLIVFDGLDEDCVKKIVFIEIKTGASTLSTRERWIRDAVLAKNIEWRQVRVNLESPDVVHEVRSRKVLSV